MTEACDKCRRPKWDGGCAISSKFCYDGFDSGFSCFLLALIYKFGDISLQARAEIAAQLFAQLDAR